MVEDLSKIVGGENVSDNLLERYVYGSDASIHQGLPDVVVKPRKVSEVQEILRYANEKRIPVIPRGAGTGECGNAVPVDGGIILDLKGMNRIKEVRLEDMFCRVEPGVVNDELNEELKGYRFFFPPTPGSGKVCTVGGMVANNASGMRAIKYGATRDSVLGLKVVLANGDLITLGTSTIVHSSGYHLERLMVGSEGTLGVIVEATIRLQPLPERRAVGIAPFSKLEEAGKAVSKIIASGIIPSALELLDKIAIKSLNRAQRANLPEVEAIVLCECDGVKSAVEHQIEKVKKICQDSGSFEVNIYDDPQEVERIWKLRKALTPATSRYREGLVRVLLADDPVVPVSKVAEAAKRIQEIGRENGIVISIVGHLGEGLFHPLFLINPRRKEQWSSAKKAVGEIYSLIYSLGGTIAGEHGIGITKAGYLQRERRESLELMRAIKRALDPNNILNPHKFMDAPEDFLTATRIRYPIGERARERKNLKKWEDEMLVCMRCGDCLSGCPAFTQLGWESATARGRVVLSYGLLEGEIDYNDLFRERIFQCTICKQCEVNCPSEVKILEVIKAARTDLAERGYYIEAHKLMKETIEKYGNIYGEERRQPLPLREGAEYALFIGCVGRYREEESIKRVVELLERIGVSFTGLEEVCCGGVLSDVGFGGDEEKVKHNKKEIERSGARKLLTTCPKCYQTFKEDPQYGDLGVEVIHITHLLNKLPLEVKTDRKITYHDPCDLGRHLGIYDLPREIIGKISSNFVEMKKRRENAQCCGAGGGLRGAFTRLSIDIARRRLESAIETGAEVLLTECPSCLHNFKNARKRRQKIEIYNISEYISILLSEKGSLEGFRK